MSALEGAGEGRGSAVNTATEHLVEFVEEQFIKAWDNGMGRLRRTDIRRRIKHLIAVWPRLVGRPATPDDAADIAIEAVAQSYAAEIGPALGWDCRLAVHVAFAILEEVNCHTEAAALKEAAKKMGAW